MTFFSEAKHHFLPVPEDGRIETEAFLNACSEIVPFFDVLGSKAFAPVKSDINGNIQKLRKKLETDKEKFKTLQSMVESEQEEGTTTAKNSATDALMWLKRALLFICTLLKEVLSGEEEIVSCAKKAYEKTLKQYHGWMVQGIFSIALKACPYRKDFIHSLGKTATEEQVLSDMKAATDLMDANLTNVHDYYVKNGHEKEGKV